MHILTAAAGCSPKLLQFCTGRLVQTVTDRFPAALVSIPTPRCFQVWQRTGGAVESWGWLRLGMTRWMSSIPENPMTPDRRSMLLGLTSLLCLPQLAVAGSEIPLEVAGIRLPRSSAARKAVQFTRANCPPYLFNHCLRTYLFGAAAMERHRTAYHEDDAFVAACLHDVGLLKPFASAKGSFEVDGANRAAQFARDNGLSAADTEEVWDAIVLHDGRFVIAEHRGGAAMLVAMGAGSDVLGPDEAMIDAKRTAEIVAAFPRLGFKKQFTSLLVEHCRRNPLSQRGTWLEGLCREQAPAAWKDKLEEEIAQAPFSE